jgi:hypothetical protein
MNHTKRQSWNYPHWENEEMIDDDEDSRDFSQENETKLKEIDNLIEEEYTLIKKQNNEPEDEDFQLNSEE